MQTDATLLANNTQQCCDLLCPFAVALRPLGTAGWTTHIAPITFKLTRLSCPRSCDACCHFWQRSCHYPEALRQSSAISLPVQRDQTVYPSASY